MASVGWWVPSTPTPTVLVLAHLTGAPGDGGTSQGEEMGPEGHGLLLCLQLPCWPLLHSQAAQRPPQTAGCRVHLTHPPASQRPLLGAPSQLTPLFSAWT